MCTEVRFLAAVSGGADSMAMLAALFAVTRKGALFCLHVEHGIRAEEGRADAEFVRNYCEKLGINCRVVSIPAGKIASFAHRNGTGIEAAARHFRRKALFRHAARLGENTLILTAHTMDDMLETTLMRVLRGAGPSGLAAIPEKHGRMLRPLLSMTRTDVIGYMTEKKIPWREDSTNKDKKFLRNRIRLCLVPLLDESFPSWKSGIVNMAQTQSLAADFIGSEAKRRVSWRIGSGEWGVVKENSVSHISFLTLHSSLPIPCLSTNKENFFSQPEIIREEALFLGIDLLLAGVKNPCPVRRSVVRRFCTGVVSAADLGSLVAKRVGGNVVLIADKKGFFESGFSLLIKEPGSYNLKKISIEVCPSCGSDKGNSFYALLPFVLRKSFKDDFLVSGGKKMARRNLAKNLISAVDAYGTAAFINGGRVLFGRDIPQEFDNQKFSYVTIKRLADV